MRTIALFLMLLAVGSVHAQQGGMLFDNTQGEHIIVNNRVLANVNGIAITVIDLQKAMDMHFYQQYPQYATVPEARHQFYKASWKGTLDDLINKELIKADAEENKLPVTQGDVRKQLEEMFGPNLIENLDKANLTYEEACELIKSDMILNRMMYFRVNSKAQKKVTPERIREAYDKYAIEHYTPSQWCYQVISIRDDDPNVSEKLATIAYEMLTLNGITLDDLTVALDEKGGVPESSKISISPRYEQKENEVSEVYREPLSTIVPGQFSSPIAQKSRTGNTPVYRIFYLEDLTPAGSVAFIDVEHEIENNLMNKAVGKETGEYITKLRDHYHFQENELNELIPSGFEPFLLK